MSEPRVDDGMQLRGALPWGGAHPVAERPVPRVTLALGTLWWREMVRFVRQRSRLVGAFAQPLVFWLLLGGGLHSSFRPPGLPADINYMTYFYPGIIVLVLLFTAIFATIAVVEDRQAGFLQGVLVAPVSRATVVLGQALGCTTLALVQGLLFLAFAPFVGIHLSLPVLLAVAAVQALLAFGLTNLGLIIAWRMDSTQGFHAIMNLILIPIWLLSGAVFPATGASVWMERLMLLNPLTYGMAALRRCLYLGEPPAIGSVPSLLPSLLVLVTFAVVTFWVATTTATRRRGD
jgi:ABC-2 type transport system permease protein